MKIRIHQPQFIHEIGQRTNQEDALWPLSSAATENDRVFIVCDGMGGHEKGEVASQTVSLSLGQWLKENTNPDETFNDEQLAEALRHAYSELDKKDDGSPKKMGTTLTLLYIHRNGITAAHIGDSRIYHIRPKKGTLYQSRDHSLVFDLYQAGEIKYEEMATYPQKNIITRAMQPGEDNRVRPDVIHITDVLPGDYFYMCSDGMLESTSNEELEKLLAQDISDEAKRQQLIASTAGNSDNHTAWLIHISEVAREECDATLTNEEPTARCNALNIKPQVTEPKNAPATATDDDDVIVVSTPQAPAPQKRRKRTAVSPKRLATFALLVILATIAALFVTQKNDNKNTEPQRKHQKHNNESKSLWESISSKICNRTNEAKAKSDSDSTEKQCDETEIVNNKRNEDKHE